MCGFNSTELYRSKLLNSFLFSVKKKWIEKVDLSIFFSVLSNDVGRYCHL